MSRLLVAQKAHSFTLEIYQATVGFPAQERNGLTAQLRRSAVSIGSNIAEGDGSDSNRVFVRHLSIALGSASEVAYQLLLARDLGWLDDGVFKVLEASLEEVQAMLLGLSAAVRRRQTVKSDVNPS